MAKGLQGIEGGQHLENDIAAAAAIAAVGPAARNEFLPVKVDHAVAALAGAHENFSVIDEHRLPDRLGGRIIAGTAVQSRDECCLPNSNRPVTRTRLETLGIVDGKLG